ncbi:7011_t:CDS:2 [Ambispora gerdemannii]|uniref:7011_t:CDS:1 n=1 Tax=Ambispora gerdemannii TaxID=144530 RepID=A0A9N9CP68_9GLOM|nr:7011_t:CDS:2 [Ambispora gerdemannii]
MTARDMQLIRYGDGESENYSSDSNTYSYNISECESENCSDYGSDYESDIETNTIETPVSQPPNIENKFLIQHIPWSKVCKIASSPTRDMSNNRGSLEEIHLWDYLLPNYGAKEGISLLDAYTQEALADKLVIQVEQEVYGLPGIHEYINGQRPLRTVIDIDASREVMEAEKVKARD